MVESYLSLFVYHYKRWNALHPVMLHRHGYCSGGRWAIDRDGEANTILMGCLYSHHVMMLKYRIWPDNLNFFVRMIN